MTIKQYIPNFVSGIESQTAEFNTVEELREIPFVKSHIETEGHYRLSISRNLLMNELNEGYVWFVVGTLLDELPDLPQAEYKFRS